MTSTLTGIPRTNLKDRIAALEQQKVGNANTRPTSPTQTVPPTSTNGVQSVGALRDKIAKFERKGGVPVPRGSFGLGAPPSSDVPRRQGELYGNRFQRSLTPQFTGGSRASSPIGSLVDSRRSFSTSIVSGNFDDDYTDYTPVSSPTSPISPGSTVGSPDTSPSLTTNGEVPNFKRNPTRGTSFHEALEFARKVEAAKHEASMAIKKTLTDSVDANEKVTENPTTPVTGEKTEAQVPVDTPSILVSADNRPLHGSQSQKPAESSPSETPDLPVKPSFVTSAESAVTTPDLGATTVTMASAANNRVTTDTIAGESPSMSNPIAQERQAVVLAKPHIEVHSADTSRGREEVSGGKAILLHAPQIVVDEHAAIITQAAATSIEPSNAVSPFDKESLASVSPISPLSATSLESPIVDGVGSESPLDALPQDQNTSFRTKPTIQPPDSSSFLSPPSAFLSAQVSPSASSVTSFSTLSSRPVSMIEVSRALKMTPATGRGVPIFLPPSNPQPRKSDFVYLPPSPDAAPDTAVDEDDGTLGTYTLGHHRPESEPDLTTSSKTFKAVVHGKVKKPAAPETIPSKREVIPTTPDKQNLKRATILQTPLSPGHGELAALLQEAMLLEDTLNKGDLPGEAAAGGASSPDGEADAKVAQLEEEKRHRITSVTQLRAKRDMPTQGRLKHTFLMPLSKVKAAHKKETSSPVGEPVSEVTLPTSAVLPDTSGVKDSQQKAAVAPQKSHKSSRFPTFRKFGSISRTVAQQEAWLRNGNSISSEMSEDSNVLVTPPDNNNNTMPEFGERKPASMETDSHSLSLSFPSLSPKKGSTIGRAASFAGKIWSRTRTKSNGSTTSAVTYRSTEELGPQLPVLDELPPIPSLPSIIPPSEAEQVDLSTRRRTDLVGPFTPLARVPTSVSQGQGLPKSPAQSETMNSLHPDLNMPSNPSSPLSISSLGSLPSPLFDKDLFDSFPSIPDEPPTPSTAGRYELRREQSLTAAAAAATADFDSALLSSAIHLAARNNASYSAKAQTTSS